MFWTLGNVARLPFLILWKVNDYRSEVWHALGKPNPGACLLSFFQEKRKDKAIDSFGAFHYLGYLID